MAVYLSFYYDRDAWRVQQILNMGSVESQTILSAQDWEEVQKKGKTAIETWIAEQMKYKTAVVVLIGAETASRPWVLHEIQKAWQDKRPLVGVRIHGLANSDGKTDAKGADPFTKVTFSDGSGSLAKHIPVFEPSGADSKAVHASIKTNLATWIDSAVKRA